MNPPHTTKYFLERSNNQIIKAATKHMVKVEIPLPPHVDANMHDTFMTTHDKDYNITNASTVNSIGQDNGSGHLSNRPLFARPRGQHSPTAHQDFFPARNGTLSAEQWHALRLTALKPKEDNTAFVRLGSTHRFPGAVFSGPTESTMKASYHNCGTVGSPPSEWPAMYSGAATTSYNPGFLFVNSPPDNTPVATGFQEKHDVIKPHPGRSRLTHTANLPGMYFQHSRLIGDRSLAYPNQLPVGLSSASDFSSTRGRSLGARSMLDTLSGRSISSAPSVNSIASLYNTNPLAMSPPEQETCRVAHRVENQGHVRGTTYQANFVRQQNLPELTDPSKAKKSKMVVALPNVKAQAHETAVLTDSRGQLLAEKPEGVHTSVWRRLKTMEKTLSVDKIDPHAHKLRSVSVR